MNLKRISLAVFTTLLAGPLAAQDCPSDQRAFEHLGGTTCIPNTAERVIGLHDQSVTLTLIELGAPVVGSHGRAADDGSIYMRAVDLLFGYDFENAGIAYVGQFDQLDYEAMAALQPDLIIGREWEREQEDQLNAIAPTVFIPESSEDPFVFSRGIADAVGMLDEWQAMHDVYQANLARATFALPQVQGATYSKLQGWDGKLEVYAGYGGLTKVLHDLGFERSNVGAEMAARGVAWGETVSPEVLPELEADYLFDTYTIAYGDTLAAPFDRLNEVVPNWCSYLAACEAGRYIVLPREYSTGFSFGQLNMLLQMITTNVANTPAIKG